MLISIVTRFKQHNSEANCTTGESAGMSKQASSQMNIKSSIVLLPNSVSAMATDLYTYSFACIHEHNPGSYMFYLCVPVSHSMYYGWVHAMWFHHSNRRSKFLLQLTFSSSPWTVVNSSSFQAKLKNFRVLFLLCFSESISNRVRSDVPLLWQVLRPLLLSALLSLNFYLRRGIHSVSSSSFVFLPS
jgi:hypothetical protein